MSDSMETLRGARGVRWLVGAVVVLLVVVVILVVQLVRRSGSDVAQTSTATPAVTLDDVIPGEGATRQSVNVPAVGVGYPDTCVGAAQAAAGWTTDLLGGLTAENGASVEALEAALQDEVLASTYTRTPGGDDPAEVIVTAAQNWAEEPDASPVNEVHLEYGAFRLASCTEGQEAAVTVYGPLLTNGWRGGSPTTPDGSAYENVVVYSFALVSEGGQWRIRTVRDEMTADTTGALDYLAPWGEAFQAAGTARSSEAQKALVAAVGAGGHAYVHGE